jgi:hypothetical protein
MPELTSPSEVSRVVWPRTEGERVSPAAGLRRFGLLQGGALVVVGAVLRYGFGHPLAANMVWGLAAIAGILAIVRPEWLGPGRALGRRLAEYVGRALTVLLLTPVFYLVFGTVGLLLRLSGRDPLALRRDRRRSSYWLPRTRVAPAREYVHQFRIEERAPKPPPEARR